MSKTYLFTVFDLNDYNYLKMPWRIVVEVIPALSKVIPNSTFYVLTDSKPVSRLREILERNNNVKVISMNMPVLRYPYRGLVQSITILKRRLNIDTLIAFSGVNLFVWIRVARALGIKRLVLMFLTPIYTWRELAVITTRSVPRLFRYGTILDLLDFLKLLYENVFAKLILPITIRSGLTGDLEVHVVVMHDNALDLFKNLRLKVHKATPRLTHVGERRKHWHINAKKELKAAYFGPLILARGYDIVLELSRKLPKDLPLTLTIFSRSNLTRNLLDTVPGATLNVNEKFFKSFEEIAKVAEDYDLILLPFRFVLSDIPLVVLELACSGTLVVTTPYSHVTKSSPNLLILDIGELEDAGRITRLADLTEKLRDRHDEHAYVISWENLIDSLKEILKGEG